MRTGREPWLFIFPCLDTSPAVIVSGPMWQPCFKTWSPLIGYFGLRTHHGHGENILAPSPQYESLSIQFSILPIFVSRVRPALQSEDSTPKNLLSNDIYSSEFLQGNPWTSSFTIIKSCLIILYYEFLCKYPLCSLIVILVRKET